MNPLIARLQAMLGPRAGIIAGLGAPVAVLLILSMMVLPLPPFALDLMFTFNIAMAVMVMMVAAHMVRPLDFAAFPTVLLLTGLHDGRVEPYQSMKMAARLQAVAGAMSGKPVLLRVAEDAGHGQGMALGSAIEQQADVFAFLFDALDLK